MEIQEFLRFQRKTIEVSEMAENPYETSPERDWRSFESQILKRELITEEAGTEGNHSENWEPIWENSPEKILEESDFEFPWVLTPLEEDPRAEVLFWKTDTNGNEERGV